MSEKCFPFTLVLLLLLSVHSVCVADGIDGDEDAELSEITEEDVDPEQAEGPAACTFNEDCPVHFECLDFVCMELAPGNCVRDGDCDDFRSDGYCDIDRGYCRYFCFDDGICDPEEYCNLQNNHCESIPGDSDNFCKDNDDCANDSYCDMDLHACRLKCNRDQDCSEGEICIEARCVESMGDEDIESTVDGDTDVPGGDSVATDGDDKEDEDIGLIDCPPGQVCLNDGDQVESDDTGGCNSGQATLWLLPLFAILSLRYLFRKPFVG